MRKSIFSLGNGGVARGSSFRVDNIYYLLDGLARDQFQPAIGFLGEAAADLGADGLDEVSNTAASAWTNLLPCVLPIFRLVSLFLNERLYCDLIFDLRIKPVAALDHNFHQRARSGSIVLGALLDKMLLDHGVQIVCVRNPP